MTHGAVRASPPLLAFVSHPQPGPVFTLAGVRAHVPAAFRRLEANLACASAGT